MSQENTPYNQIDFIVKAPRFRIVFSYMDEKGVAFIREYLLRLLKLTPCTLEQVARYFGFNKHEIEIALSDLEQNEWISWQDDGLVALSAEGECLFQNTGDKSPKIPTLQEFGGEYRMELLDNNFLQKKDSNQSRQYAIELMVEPRVLSESQETVRKTFQNRFRQLIEENIIEIIDKDISLYKIDVIEPIGRPDYFRFTQQFELLPETGEAKERHDVPVIIYQENIQQSITQIVNQFGRGDNMQELWNSINEIGDEDTLNVLFGGKLGFNKFLEIYQKHEQENGSYFLGQIYHQKKANENDPTRVFDEIKRIIGQRKKPSQSKKLYWLAPSDIYWGKQRKIHDCIQHLVDEQKNRNYNFRLYVPLPPEENKRECQQWLHEFRDIEKKILYGFHEGFLAGNTEILFLEDTFAVVCYHAKLSSYPVTLPIGFMTTKVDEVKEIEKLVIRYLSDSYYGEDEIKNDFGLLSGVVSKRN